MIRSTRFLLLLTIALAAAPLFLSGRVPQVKASEAAKPEFRTSDRCVACHNGLKTNSGEDISIGFDWRASIMANSSRDPYWQGSLRRESLDHPESQAAIENECSTCHMPVAHLTNRFAGKPTEVFSQLPLNLSTQKARAASDGVSCAVCHQIEKDGLGTDATFNGNVAVAMPADKNHHLEYGPFVIDAGHQRVMQSSTGGYVPQNADHMRDSALCSSCHTLYTKALGPDGKEIGKLPEQMPYQEWLHSDYPGKKSTCQSCHMPEVNEPVAVTALYGQPRTGMHRHTFVGSNFLMEGMLKDHRDELGVQALPEELDAAMARTKEFLQTKAARINLRRVDNADSRLTIDVSVENLTGHKLPTAYPSRRAWLRVVVYDRNGQPVFESGALHADGSIAGNKNDEDALSFEPHHIEISDPHQVEIFEPILKDANGHVTTGLLSAVGYLKDNRLLPSGFDKGSASHDIAVVGEAEDDPRFTDHGSTVRYIVTTGNAQGPFRVEAELWYQPIGYRWAHNLERYGAAEPQRMVGYYKSQAAHSAIVLAKTGANF